MKHSWWKEAVIYQIYPRSFMDSDGDGVGDLQGIIMKLDYLKELGIDVIWLSPVYQSPNDDNGYDISNYREIMNEFGTMETFDRLLLEAHKREIKIMMDLVVNHSSDEHPWFVEARSSKDSPYRDYYIWRPAREDGHLPNNWGSHFGGSVWEYEETTGEYFLHLYSKKQPDFNWENPSLRREVYDIMTFWLDKGVDGFRMDVINMISKAEGLPDGEVYEGYAFGDGNPYYSNGPKIHEYLQEMNREVLSKYDLITVGEMPKVGVEQAKLYTGSDRGELNMIFHFEHVTVGNGQFGRWSPVEWKLTELKRIFSRWQYGLKEDGWNSLYWSNHDQPRAVSRFGDDSSEYRVLSAKMLATCLHMLQGTPYIYQGEELGMTNVGFASVSDYRDIQTVNAYRDYVEAGALTHEQMMDAIHQRSRDNGRTPMQWSDAGNAGFTSGVPWIAVNPNYKDINAERAMSDPDSVFHYYKKLIRLRKKHKIIVYGASDILSEEDEHIFAFTRSLGTERLLVLCNFSRETLPVKLPEEFQGSDKDLLIGNYQVHSATDRPEDSGSLQLLPYEARVYRVTV
ncbi:glycoside hydrolase family 13 protein [Paenibacillus sonchi]|uniref:glycoside hydrolase family 13 protein n=1 Tax=Paenibacillus sonchi TaxID=373687 RepID=UPI001E50C1FE|nr:alpha-glucosidase [Paenibacillus sonchi]MCE3203737.1 alpha-glucosidase [Paenibacillus sonchi]